MGKFVKQSHGVPFNINNFVCLTEQAVTKKQTSKMGDAFFCFFQKSESMDLRIYEPRYFAEKDGGFSSPDTIDGLE